MTLSRLKSTGLLLSALSVLYWSWHVGPRSPQTKIEEAVAGISLLAAAFASFTRSRPGALRGGLAVASITFGVIAVDQYVTGGHDLLGTIAFALIFLGLGWSAWSTRTHFGQAIGFGLAAAGTSIWIGYDYSAGVMTFQPGNVIGTLGLALSAWGSARSSEGRTLIA